jgi:hypothetical protein
LIDNWGFSRKKRHLFVIPHLLWNPDDVQIMNFIYERRTMN